VDKIDLSEVLQSIGYTGMDAFADGVVGLRGNNNIVTIDPDGFAGSARTRNFLLVQGAMLSAGDIITGVSA
jgi:hypothetical protein